jgi:hypothetical protein
MNFIKITLSLLGFIAAFIWFVNSQAGETCETKTQSQEVATLVNALDVPAEYLVDAEITVKLPNGKEYKYSANEFKVVKRLKEVMAYKTVETVSTSCHSEYKNRAALLLGYGPKDSLDKKVSPTQVEVSNTQGAVVGAQYQRSITERLNLGVQVQSNKTNSLMLGLDF